MGVGLLAMLFKLNPEDVMQWRVLRFDLWLEVASRTMVQIRQSNAVAIGEAVGMAWYDPSKLYELIPGFQPPEKKKPTKEELRKEKERALANARRISKMTRFRNEPPEFARGFA